MALVLASSVPSGAPGIVLARAKVAGCMFHQFDCRQLASAPAALSHTSTPMCSLPASHVYIGFGRIDSQDRPSLWANPYTFVCASPVSARSRFAQFLRARCDLHDYLYPLAGRTLVCDCDAGPLCHGLLLTSLVNERFSACSDLKPFPSVPALPASADSFLFESEPPCPHPDADVPSDDNADDSGDEAPPVGSPLSPDDLSAVNETVRGTRLHAGRERPAWKPAWFDLITMVRAAQVLLFWEIFSGCAGLTREFVRQDWSAAPPIDIL